MFENDFAVLLRELRDSQSQNAELVNTLRKREDSIADLEKTLCAFRSKQDKKDDSMNNLQTRIQDLMSENTSLHKQLASQQVKDSLIVAAIEQPQAKERVHTPRTICGDNRSPRPSTDRQYYADDLVKDYKRSLKEINELQDENKELKSLAMHWEAKFRGQSESYEHLRPTHLKEIEKDHRKKQNEIRNSAKQDLKLQEKQYRESMNVLEREFKTLLLENNNKLIELRQLYEEQTVIIADQNTKNKELVEALRQQQNSLKTSYLRVPQLQPNNTRSTQKVL